MRIIWNEVPEYVLALERENMQRDCAFFLDVEILCGLEVLPFTPRHFVILANVGSPFLCGGIASLAEMARFIWVVSPDFRPVRKTSSWKDRRARSRCIKRCRKLDVVQASRDIESYIEEAFLDSPGGSAPNGAPSDVSLAASIVDLLGSAYGWSEQVILGLPFKRIWQYYRAIRKRNDPDAVFINTLTDRAKREHWQKILKSKVN